MRVRGFRNGKRWAVVGLLFATNAWSTADLAAQQKKDEPPRFGNGALLRRLFGDTEGPKATSPKPKAPERPSLEASRQRLKDDTDKLKDKLGFGSSRETGGGVAQGRISDQANAAGPRSQFNPQGATRQTISDYGDPSSSIAPPLHYGNPLPGETATARPLATAPRPTPSSGLTAPPTWRPDPPGRSENSVLDIAPRNQPRVPAQPTLAARPTTAGPTGVPASPAALPLNQAGTDIRGEAVTETGSEEGPPTTFGAFGIIVDPKATGPGLTIRAVRPKSIAATIGLKPGDVLRNVAGLDIGVVQEIDSLVEVLEPEDEFEITFIRQGKSQTQTFSVPNK